MKYVIDSSAIIDMKHFYPNIFPSIWKKINELVKNIEIISVKEAYHEITGRADFLSEWAKENESIFEIPTEDEYKTVSYIMSKHKELVRNDSISGGRHVADPFLIAKAFSKNLILITNETFTPNGHKIPNVCKELNVKYLSLEEFMTNEGWEF